MLIIENHVNTATMKLTQEMAVTGQQLMGEDVSEHRLKTAVYEARTQLRQQTLNQLAMEHRMRISIK